MKVKIETKADEIQILEALKANRDLYLAELFTPIQIDIMIDNIKNDFPASMNAGFPTQLDLDMKHDEILNLGKTIMDLQNLSEGLKKKIKDFATDLIDLSNTEYVTDLRGGIERVALDMVGRREVILNKIGLNMMLSDDDKNYIANNLKA